MLLVWISMTEQLQERRTSSSYAGASGAPRRISSSISERVVSRPKSMPT